MWAQPQNELGIGCDFRIQGERAGLAIVTGSLKVIEPATEKVLAEVEEAGVEEADRAVARAQAAFPAWRRVSPGDRANLLRRLAAAVQSNAEKLSLLEARNVGKPISDARGEVGMVGAVFNYYAGAPERLLGDTIPVAGGVDMTFREPLGVVALIVPWNFPIAIPTWKLFPALLCGNTVVFKPAEDTPGCATRLVELFEEAGLPPGVLNLVTGFGPEAGTPLVEDERVRMISFTGSSVVGREIAVKAGRSLKKVMLELGGKNAMIVLPDANLDLALEGALWGAFGTTGQRCTATSRIIVHRDVADTFSGRLVERARKLRIGFGLDPDVEVGPLINEQQLKTVENYVTIGQQEGARLLLGGKILTGDGYDRGYFYAPTVFTDVNYRMRIAQEEIFGPVVAIMPVSSYEEAVTVANSTEYGLSSAIYTQDINLAFRAVRDLEAGITYVNAPTIGAEIQLPFGGVKATGNGHREAGTSAIKEFTEIKAVYVDYSGKLQRAQIDVEL